MFINEPTLGGDFSIGARRASTPCSRARPASRVGGQRDHQVRRLLRRPDADQAVQRLLPGRLAGQPELHAQHRPPVRLLRRPRTSTRAPTRSTRRSSTQTTYNESYLKDFQGWDGITRNDKNDWAPRLGFSWDIKGDGRQHPARRLGPLLRLPVQQRHDPLPGDGGAVGLRRRLLLPRRERDQERRRHATSSPASRCLPNQLPGADVAAAQRDSLADAQAPVLRPDLARLLVAGHQLARLQPRGGEGRATATSRSASAPTRSTPRRASGGSRTSATSGCGTARVRPTTRESTSASACAARSSSCRGSTPTPRPTGNILGGADEFRITRVEYQPDLALRPRPVRQPLRPAVQRVLRAARHRCHSPRDPRRDLPFPVRVRGLRDASLPLRDAVHRVGRRGPQTTTATRSTSRPA